MNGRIKLFVIDDSPIFRAGLIQVLKNETSLEISGSVEYSNESIKDCVLAAPEMLLLHLSSQDAGAHAKIIGSVRKKIPDLRILVISEYTDANYLLEVVTSGCDGYVLSSISERALKKIIRKLSADVCVFDRSMLSRFLLLSKKYRNDAMKMSPRERHIVELLANGMDNTEIADELGLAAGTIKNIISCMLQRWHFKKRTQLVNLVT
ncbi:MAG: response regulator transcription factor [Synergistaceae bacterium]|jgi:DNA-binding NarL/FixJ family response regulator|nr:response regulator transcription factor [Synergistaceae bacterium]